MSRDLKKVIIEDFVTEQGRLLEVVELTYETFGVALHTGAPVVLVCHALTGNSTVAGPQGWWQGIIGDGNVIDTKKFSVVGINIPGNGYDEKPENLLEDHRLFTARDVARLFIALCEKIGIDHLDAVIGGSLGGGIAWEMAFLKPDYITLIVPVASDWKASDWILAHNRVQEQILENSSKPLHDARMMAMMFYRTPNSFKAKFNRTHNEELGIPNVESWLLHHGKRLEQRFELSSYKVMNHLLSSVDVSRGRASFEELAGQLKARVVQVAVDSDFFFTADENRITHQVLLNAGVDARYAEIHSEHGHDAFLIEFEQMREILREEFDKFIQLKKAGNFSE